jgi:hypothetical protein
MKCPLCDQDMAWYTPCSVETIDLPIHTRQRAEYRRVIWTGRRLCPDCGTSPGCPHHLCCDRERCPVCGDDQRLTSCLEHFLVGGPPLASR